MATKTKKPRVPTAKDALKPIWRRLTPAVRAVVRDCDVMSILPVSGSWMYMLLLSKNRQLIYLGQSLESYDDDMLARLSALMKSFRVEPTLETHWAGMVGDVVRPAEIADKLNSMLDRVADNLSTPKV